MRQKLFAGLLLSLCSALVQAQTSWPKIALPKDVNAFHIGEQATVNDMPMRMQGFVSHAKPVQLADWFRQSLGQPLIENTLARKLILGRKQGEYYITVQLESVDMGTRGVIAVTQLNAAYDQHGETRAATDRLLSRLPAGSRLISQMASDDDGKHARYLVIVNTHNEDLNRDRVVDMMREDGLILEREASAGNKAAGRHDTAMANAKTLFFKGQGKEAIAVIHRDATGRTAIVLSSVSQMVLFK